MLNEMTGTKLKIFESAAELFAKEGYHAVSMRQIAKNVDIKAASIYNHFESKEAILMAIYQYFNDRMKECAPDLDEILLAAETKHPHDVLRMLTMIFPKDSLHLMSTSMLVTSSMARFDPIANEILFHNLIDMPERYDRPLLERLIELDRIEPIDIDSFILVHTNYCNSSANLFYMNEEKSIPLSEWLDGLELIYKIIQPKI